MKAIDQIRLLIRSKALDIGVALADGWKTHLESKMPSTDVAGNWRREIGLTEQPGVADFKVELSRMEFTDESDLKENAKKLNAEAREMTSEQFVLDVLNRRK